MANILVCDDERSICEMLDISLRREGHRVETVQAGQTAKNKIDGALYDVIITDIKMPVMTGTEMIRELRNDAWGKSAKVVVLTNFSDMDVLQEVLKQGALCIVKGDMKMEEIVGQVDELLNKKPVNPLL